MDFGMDPMWVLILGGLVLLGLGGDFLVRSAVDIARHLDVSPLLIGLTLVGFGTSTPELVTSVHAAFIHSPGIAIGNIVGSNIANVLLIVGIAAFLTPIAASMGAVWRDGFVVLLTSVVLTVISLNSGLTLQVGIYFLAALVGYVVVAWLLERQQADQGQQSYGGDDMSLGFAIVVALVSLGVLIMGARMLVDGSVTLARSAGLSETFIGLTLVAVGTSLPELFTSVVAAFRRNSDIAIGNVLGSNIYNILGVGGATALVHPINVPTQITEFDNLVMIAAALIVIGWLAVFRGVGRIGGLLFVALYCGYIWIIHPSNVATLTQAMNWIASTGIIERLRLLGA